MEPFLIDFGAAMHLDSQHLNIIDPLISDEHPTVQVTKFTPMYSP